MPARNESFEKGHFYHIYNRGVGRQAIFRETENYYYALRLMKKYLAQTELTMIAYCLMPIHYHFVLRQDSEIAAGLFPQRLFNAYSKAFNKRYGRSGTLFEGRFKASQIEKQDYLLHVCRYVHANPVKDGLVEELEAWPFSNYLEWIGKRNGALVDRRFIAEYFDSTGDYEQFVGEYLMGHTELPEKVWQYLEGLGR